MKTVPPRVNLSGGRADVRRAIVVEFISEVGMQLGNRKRMRAATLAALIGVFCSVVLLHAQGTSGSLTGQVTDPREPWLQAQL